MRKLSLLLAAVILIAGSCSHYHDYSNTEWSDKELSEWEDLTLNSVNTVAPHATLVSHPDNESALSARWRRSDNLLSLDGMWKFNYCPTPAERPYWFLTV